MKKTLLFLSVFAVTLLASCRNDKSAVVDMPPDERMTLTTAMSGEVSIGLIGTGKATIDWGDGTTPQTVTLSKVLFTEYDKTLFTHTFSGAFPRTIAIDGQNITGLNCNNLQLTSLDVSRNNALTALYCGNNPLLTHLDVSQNTALAYLECAFNRLTTLDVSQNTALRGLTCPVNRLTTLDVSRNKALTSLSCQRNLLTERGLNALFGTLHRNPGTPKLYIGNNPGTASCDTSIATAKGWEPPRVGS